tara:strand:- start:126 stop:542 length:417 start_codon:yes stop_codon:yes gene_type:complete
MITDNATFIILLILTSIALVILLYGVLTKSENHNISGIFCLVIIGLMGWGLVGTTITVETREYTFSPDELTINRTDSNVIIESPVGLLVYNKKIDFDNINDKTKFVLSTEYNIYNSYNGKRVYYINPKTLNKEKAFIR